MEILLIFVLVLQFITLIQNHHMGIKQTEVAAELVALKEQVVKIKAEVTAKLTALAEAIANQGNASPEVEAALADLKSVVTEVDELNEDTPVEPPVEPTV